jgi:hypothetical protein
MIPEKETWEEEAAAEAHQEALHRIRCAKDIIILSRLLASASAPQSTTLKQPFVATTRIIQSLTAAISA